MDIQLIKKLAPKSKRDLITDKFVNTINQLGDPQFREKYKENIVTFIGLWEEFPRLTVGQFGEAVLFCTHKLLGSSSIEAWKRTFPHRYADHLKKPNGENNCYHYAKSYARNKLVIRIMERSMVPVHILNADVHQEAINVQAELMRTAKSENVRMKAAECLINALAPPAEATLNVNVTHKGDLLDELKETTRLLAQQQRKAIQERRANVRQIAESDIIDITPVREQNG